MRADTRGLNAVQDEIKQGLDRVRQALEAFIEEEADRQALATCLDDLHQIHGTLKVVRLHAAAQLADDMQQALQGVIDDEVEASEELFEVFFGAVLQLADYLDYVPQAREDTDLLLLPVINELRVAREQPVLGEDDLFVQVLLADPPDDVQPPGTASGEDLQKAAARSLAPFQSALLGVLRQAEGNHLQRMRRITADLQSAGDDPASQRLWWLTAAVAEALEDDSLVAGIELKRLLGRLSLFLSKLAQRGVAALDSESRALECGLLYHVGRSEGRGVVVSAVRQAYGLDALLPPAEALAQIRVRLRGPNTALLSAVANEIRSDLGVVQDNLDLLMRSGELSEEHSQQTSGALRRVGATLGMLGLDDLERVVKRQAGVIESAQGQPDPASSEWQAVATSLLWIEHSLDAILLQKERGEALDPTLAEPSAEAISPRELQAGAQSILREALVNLSRVRDQLEQFARVGEAGALEEAPRLLHEIGAGLAILQHQEAARLVSRLGQALDRSQWPSLQADTRQLDRLADALADAEKLIETLRMEEDDSASLLQELEDYVGALEGKAEGGDAPESFLELELPEDEYGQTTDADAEAAAPEPAAARVDVVDGIQEIFLEELEDIQLDLAGSLPDWKRDTSDLAALGEVRRSFHTLKGSGRMAGSEQIGAFGWAVEQLLNRCLEAEQPVTETIVSLVQSAVDELPALARGFAENEPLPESARRIVQQAHQLTGTEAPAELLPEGTTPPADAEQISGPETEVPEVEELEAVESGAPAGEAEDEEDIRHIFLADALGHMEVVGAFLAESGPSLDPMPVSREVVRAFHTLKSGAALAELQELSGLCRALEDLCDACLSQGEPMATEMLQVVQHAGEEILATLEAVQSGTVLPELAGLTQEVDELQSLLTGRDGGEVSAEEQAEMLAFTDEAAGLLEQIESRLSALEMDSDNPDERDRLLSAMHALGDLAQANDIDAVARVADRMHQVASVDLSHTQRQTCADVALEVYGLLDELRQNRRDLEVDDLLARFDSFTAATGTPSVPEPPAVPEAELPTDEEPVSTVPVASAEEEDSDEMLELFLGEGEELLEGIDQALDAWEKDLQATAPRAELLRNLHTIKGGARMAGALDIGDASHELESRIEAQQRSGEAVDKAFLGDLRNNVDQIHGLLDRFRAAPSQPAEPREPVAEAAPGPAPASPSDMPSSWAESLYWQPETDADADRAAQSETARVPVERLDAMLNEAGEINIYRGRLEQQHADLVAQLGEFEQAVERLRNLLRELDIQTDAQVHAGRRQTRSEGDRYDEHFDPLEMDRYTRMNELSRSLNESAADLASLHGLMDEATHDAETLLLQQGRITTSLQHGLMDTLLVPFTRQVQRLQRVVRQVSQSHERATRVEFEGEELELDRNVLDRMIGPLEHLLRNAVVHGIEPAGERREAGKPEEGLVRVVLRREGTQSMLEISDDGRGLDARAIRKHAEERGMIPKGTGLDDDLLWQFIFEPGFSTADELTHEAGRGVGLDVVNAEIKQLGGTISVASKPGEGTRFSIRIPSSLAITNALLVRVGAEQYAIPMSSIAGVERIERQALDDGADDIIEYGGNQYQLARLSDYVNAAHTATDEEHKSLPVLLIQAGETPLALVVDKVLGGQELVVKSLGPQVSAITGVKGGSILADGSVVLILDIQALHQMQRRRGLSAQAPADAGPEHLQDERPMVMVVDDSITIRRVTEKFLLRNGFRVCTAKDGMDALPKLQTEAPDLVLLDIEMPRIDGFEFATYMRNNEHFANIPIIMITSRSGEKHQQRAAQIGVQDYMIKPYQEDALLRSINEVLQAAGGTA